MIQNATLTSARRHGRGSLRVLLATGALVATSIAVADSTPASAASERVGATAATVGAASVAGPKLTLRSAYITGFTDLATGFALDSNASGSVYTLRANGGDYQRWIVRDTTYGAVTLRNVATGRCLDSNTARQVYTLGCNGGTFQKWAMYRSTYGTKVLRNVATGFVLDSNADRQVYTMGYNGGSYQKWIVR